MRSLYFGILLLTMTLSPAICRAEKLSVSQNFNTLAGNGGISFNSPSNTIGTTDFVTYTCSGGANFDWGTKTDNKIAIFLEDENEQVSTSAIENLDSLEIYYVPAKSPKKTVDMTISIKQGEGEWREVETIDKNNGMRTVKMPRVGDYQVRIVRKESDDAYIKEIHFIYIDLSDCPGCFFYKPE